MKQVKETLVGFLIGIGIYAAVVEVVGIFFSDNLVSYSIGLLLGVLVSIALILHMTFTLNKALDMPEGKADGYVRLNSFLRLAIMFAVLVVGVLVEMVNIITVVLGLLGLKIGALLAPIFLKRLYPADFVTPEDFVPNLEEDEDEEE